MSEQRTSNSRKGQWTSQKYRNLVGSDQQMQRLEKTELRKADRTVGVNCIYFPIFRQARPDFFRECLQLRKDNLNNKDKSIYSITIKCGPLK